MTPEEQKINDEFNRILFKAEKKFVDNALLYFARGYFALSVYTGESSQIFALTPYQVKALADTFRNQMRRYEDTFGEVALDLSVPSPLTQAELQKPDDSGGSADPGMEPPQPPSAPKPGKKPKK